MHTPLALPEYIWCKEDLEMTYRQSDLTMLARSIADQRAALLLGDEDLTLDDLRRINSGEGFSFTRDGGLGSTLVVSEYHLADDELATVLRMSDDYL